MIIGLTGKNGSGKSTVAQNLIDKGFLYFSLSDILRDTLAAEGKTINRETLIEIGCALRETEGPGVLAEKTLLKIPKNQSCVIDSIRNPYEVKALKQIPGFQLWVVTAPLEVRFERCRSRGREGAEQTLEAFQAIENREIQSTNDNAQQLNATAALADQEVNNGADTEALKKELEVLLKPC